MDVAGALDILRAEDPELALDAEGALNGLTAGEGIEEISQIALQEFLWYRLPVKFLTDDAHKRRVAAGLGRLLELLELPRYAAMCTSDQTRTVLAAYEDDQDDRGRRVFRSAMTASGVHPVDVEELSWGHVMGMDEAGAFYTVAEALELAIVAGEFTPGARGWKQAQQAVIRQQLLRSREHLGGASLLDRVLDERVETWLTAHRGSRPEILAPLRTRLCGPAALPDDVDRHIGPVRWLLERAAEGLTLTQTHRLKPATVVAIADAFGWEHDIGVRRLEDDVREVVATRELADTMNAVRRRKLQLVLTPTGKALLGDRGALWRRLCSRLISEHAYDAAVQELALALMLQDRVASRGEVARQIARVMDGEPWRSGDGRSPDERDVSWALVDFHWRLEALSLLEHDPEQPRWQDSWRLNPAGRAAAIEALRARATRPRRSPYES